VYLIIGIYGQVMSSQPFFYLRRFFAALFSGDKFPMIYELRHGERHEERENNFFAVRCHFGFAFRATPTDAASN
jgi:hypothetical protein